MFENFMREHICGHCGKRAVYEGFYSTRDWVDIKTARGVHQHVCRECAESWRRGDGEATMDDLKRMLRRAREFWVKR